jgi:uncharacterized protein YlbG (UPF0298 family)
MMIYCNKNKSSDLKNKMQDSHCIISVMLYDIKLCDMVGKMFSTHENEM